MLLSRAAVKSDLPFKKIIPHPAMPCPNTEAQVHEGASPCSPEPMIGHVGLSSPPFNLWPNPIKSASNVSEAQPSLCIHLHGHRPHSRPGRKSFWTFPMGVCLTLPPHGPLPAPSSRSKVCRCQADAQALPMPKTLNRNSVTWCL